MRRYKTITIFLICIAILTGLGFTGFKYFIDTNDDVQVETKKVISDDEQTASSTLGSSATKDVATQTMEKAEEVSKAQSKGQAADTKTAVVQNVKKPLEGYIIGIDPGHQRKGNSSLEPIAPNSKEKKAKVSSGTQGVYTGVPEYKLNLKVGLLLKEELLNLGAKVVMTREEDNVDISNQQRAALTNEANCDIVIRIHANGADSEKTSGYSILVPGKKYTPDIVQQSTDFAKLLDAKLRDKVDIKSEGVVTREDLTGFNWSITPVVLLEMGYMSNKHDDKLMQTDNYQKTVVKLIAVALEEYFNK